VVVRTLDKSNKKRFRLSGTTSGYVARFLDERIAGKLMAMGVLPGSHVRLIRRAPFGGGWYVKVDNLLLALRQQEIECIVLNQE
jgi:ferrous iron transport protein A